MLNKSSKYCILAELIKIILGFYLLDYHNKSWFNLGELFTPLIIVYFIISCSLTIQFYSKQEQSIISI